MLTHLLGQRMRKPAPPLLFALETVGTGNLRRVELMLKPRLRNLERHRHVEDLLAVLDRDHAPCRERFAVP